MAHGPPGSQYTEPYFDELLNFKLPPARMFTYHVTNRTWSSTLLDKSVVKRISTASWVSNQRLRRGYVLGGAYITEAAATGRVPPSGTNIVLGTMTQYDFEKKEWNTDPLPDEIGKRLMGG